MFAVGSPLAGGITPAQTRARLLSIPSDAFGIDLCLVVIAVDVLGYLRYDSIAAATGGGAAATATAMVMVGVVPKFLFGLNVHGRMLVLKMVLGARLCLCGIGRIRTIKLQPELQLQVLQVVQSDERRGRKYLWDAVMIGNEHWHWRPNSV